MKNIKYLFQSLFVIAALVLTACEDENYELGDINAPSNLQVSVDIVGVDIDNPFFGSGFGNIPTTLGVSYAYM